MNGLWEKLKRAAAAVVEGGFLLLTYFINQMASSKRILPNTNSFHNVVATSMREFEMLACNATKLLREIRVADIDEDDVHSAALLRSCMNQAKQMIRVLAHLKHKYETRTKDAAWKSCLQLLPEMSRDLYVSAARSNHTLRVNLALLQCNDIECNVFAMQAESLACRHLSVAAWLFAVLLNHEKAAA